MLHSYVRLCASHNDAVSTSKRLHLKPSNNIFVWHLLACKQQTEQFLDDFLQKLRQLSRDCDHEDVTAEVHRNEAICDVFISGISSLPFRLRQLETACEESMKLWATPIVPKSRRQPTVNQKCIEETIQKRRRDWAQHIAVETSSFGDIRRDLSKECASITAKLWISSDGYPLPNMQELESKIAHYRHRSILGLKSAYQTEIPFEDCPKYAA